MKKQSSGLGSIPLGPELEELHALVLATWGDEKAVERALVHLLLTSTIGRAYLQRAKALRPCLEINRNLDLGEIIITHDAAKLVCSLIADSRYGTDPEIFIWKDFKKDSLDGDPDAYDAALEILQVMESRAEGDEEIARLRQVREAVETEIRMEKYVSWRNTITRKEVES